MEASDTKRMCAECANKIGNLSAGTRFIYTSKIETCPECLQKKITYAWIKK